MNFSLSAKKRKKKGGVEGANLTFVTSLLAFHT